MSEVKIYKFSYKEVAEALVKKQKIHEGLWAIYVQFGLQAGNVPFPARSDDPMVEETAIPSAIVPILSIGIQRVDKGTMLSVDASVVNPGKKNKKVKRDNKEASSSSVP